VAGEREGGSSGVVGSDTKLNSCTQSRIHYLSSVTYLYRAAVSCGEC
jgi:hypothetical protein